MEIPPFVNASVVAGYGKGKLRDNSTPW